MLVKVNGDEVNIPEGSTIKDAINETDAPYVPGSIVCLIKGQSELESNVNKYKLKSEKGSIIIELSENEEVKPLIDFWKENYTDFEGLKIRWSSTNEVEMEVCKAKNLVLN